MKKFSKVLAIVLALVMCVSCFTACSMFEKGPKDAAELLAKSSEVMKKNGKNFQIDMMLSAHIALAMEESGASVDIDLPIEMNMEMAMAGNYIHGEMELEGEAKATVEYEGEKETQSEEMDESSEVYIVIDDDETTTYTKDSDDVWYVSTEELDESTDIEDMLDEELFKDAEMTKDGDYYIVTVKFSDVMKNDKFKDALEDGAESADMESLGMGDVDIDDVIDMLGDAAITYKFDKEYRLVEMSTGKIEFDMSKLLSEEDMEEAGIDPDDIEISMEFSVKLSKFGEIKEKDVKVPDDVKDEAVEEPEFDIDIDIGDDDATEPDDSDDSTETQPSEDDEQDETKPSKDDNDAPVSSGDLSDNWADMDVEIDGVVYNFPYDYDLLAENGWALDLVGMGYEDGYILNKNDQLSSTIDLYNEKYNSPDDWDAFTFWCGFQNFGSKAADITECDLWSIQLDIMNGFEKVEKYPTVKIAKGITWGSTMDEVLTAFGEPDDKYESKGDGYDYARLEWRDDGKYMTITVDTALGVTAIEFDNYG